MTSGIWYRECTPPVLRARLLYCEFPDIERYMYSSRECGQSRMTGSRWVAEESLSFKVVLDRSSASTRKKRALSLLVLAAGCSAATTTAGCAAEV